MDAAELVAVHEVNRVLVFDARKWVAEEGTSVNIFGETVADLASVRRALSEADYVDCTGLCV